ncbi:MAG: hypothetical protein U0Q19_03550 [Kineosporiaceae bacterium]
MHSALLWAEVGGGLALTVIGLVMAARDRMQAGFLLGFCLVLEVVVLAQVIVAAVGLVRGHAVASRATLIGYLLGIILVLPAAVVWGWAERTRWTPAVVALGGFTVMAMAARITMMWANGG